MVLHDAEQVTIGNQLPNVQLLLPSAADPDPESYVMTHDLFNGTAAFQAALCLFIKLSKKPSQAPLPCCCNNSAFLHVTVYSEYTHCDTSNAVA